MQKSALKQIFHLAALVIAIFSGSLAAAEGFDTAELLRVGQITDTALLAEEIERAHPLRVRRHPFSILFMDLREADYDEDEWQSLTHVRRHRADGNFHGNGKGGVIVVLKSPGERAVLLHEFAHFLIAKTRDRPRSAERTPASVGLLLHSVVMEEMEINQFLLKHRRDLQLKPNEVRDLTANVRYDANLYFAGDSFKLEGHFPTYEELGNFREIKSLLFAEVNSKATAFLRADPELRAIERGLNSRNRRLRFLCLFPGACVGLLLSQVAERSLSQTTSLQDLGGTLGIGLAASLALPSRHVTLRTSIPFFNLAFQGASRAVVAAGCVKLLESLSASFF